jgi:cytochrome b561
LSQVLFHWIIALLVIYQLIFGNKIEFLELEVCKNGAINTLKNCQHLNNHYIIGVLIFLLMILRVFLRFLFGAPPLSKSVPKIIIIFARISHISIYFILLSMPVFGLLMYHYNSEIYQFLHIYFSKVLLYLILLHIFAVAFHEGVLGSKLFYRMASINKKKKKIDEI